MSDIAISFTPVELLLIGAVIGLPGAIIGLTVGALAVRRGRGWGALGGALVGDTLWAFVLLQIF